MLFDPMTGEKGKAQTRIKDGKLRVYLQLQSGESVIIQTFDHPVETQSMEIYPRATCRASASTMTGRCVLYKDLPPLSKELWLWMARLQWTGIQPCKRKNQYGHRVIQS